MNPDEKQAVASIKTPKLAHYELRVRLLAPIHTTEPLNNTDNRTVLVDVLAAHSHSITALKATRDAMEADRRTWHHHPHMRAAMDAAVALHPDKRAYLTLEFAYLAV